MDELYDVKRKALKAFLLVLILDELEENFDSASKKARFAWVSPWIMSRNSEGCYHKLLKEFLEVEKQTHLSGEMPDDPTPDDPMPDAHGPIEEDAPIGIPETAVKVRDEFANYFMSEIGKVPWQFQQF